MYNEYEDSKEPRTLRVKMFDAETSKAIGVKDPSGTMVWLPKSQLTYSVANGYIEVQVPAWLAEKNNTLEFID